MQKETTETILEKLQKSPLENIVVRMGGARYLIPTAALKLLAWNSIPDLIKDENSPDARKHGTLRTGLKALIRPFLPEILKKTWGTDIEITPRLNILSWLPAYFIHFLVNVIAAKEWQIHVEKCADCAGDVYKVVGLSPYTDNQPSPPALPAPSADHQSVSGGGESNAPRGQDRDEPGGSMGSGGGAEIGKEHMEPGATEASPGQLSSDENIHSGQQQ
jgi:hypothetical protein